MNAPHPTSDAAPKDGTGRAARREFVVVVLVALGVFLFAVFESGLPQFSGGQKLTNHITFFLLINLNILLLVVFVFLVGRNVVKLVFERRRKILGSHLRTRLVVAFIALSLGPSVLLFVASMNFLDNSIEKWFDAQVELPLEGAHEVVATYYRDAADDVRRGAEEMAERLAGEPLSDPAALAGRLQRLRRGLGVARVALHTRDGRLIAEDAAPGRAEADPPPLDTSVLSELASGTGVAAVMPLARGDVIRGVAAVRGAGDTAGVVVVERFVAPSLAARAEEIERSFREYKELRILKQPVMNTYLLTLSLITLVVVFAAIWYGLALAKGITVPIQRLAEGTRAVAQGNWDVKIEGGGEDEIGTLVRDFNQMTGDLKASSAKLEERRRHIETILANVHAGVVSVSPAGTITTLNAAAERLLGIDGRGARGRPALEVFAADSLASVREMIEALLATGVVQGERQVEVVHPDRVVTLLAAAAPLYESRREQEEGPGAVLFFEDISEILKVQRMEAWREVAQRIAHEIKNPLTPIQLSAQRLHKRYSHVVNDPVFEDCTRTIVKQVEALKSLVNEFSSFARLPTGNQAPNDLNGIVDEAIVLFREGHRSIRFDVVKDASLPSLMLDHEGIKRVLLNLLDNAVAACHANGGNGRIEIRTEALRSLDLVRLEVADDGSGMTPEVKTRLFEPYFSTKKEGTGLGLAIVSAILNEHRAFIRVRDNEPRGSRFIIEFPVGGEARAA